jgi:hypothetical protein
VRKYLGTFFGQKPPKSTVFNAFGMGVAFGTFPTSQYAEIFTEARYPAN